MPNQILQVDENMLETKLDRLVSEKVEQLLNAMLDAEADEITGARIQFVSATLVFGLAAFDCSLAISSSHTSLGVL